MGHACLTGRVCRYETSIRGLGSADDLAASRNPASAGFSFPRPRRTTQARYARLVRIGGSVVRGRLARWFEEDRTVAPLRNPDAQACMRASSSYIAADFTWPNINPVGHSEHCASTPYPFDQPPAVSQRHCVLCPRSGTTCKIVLTFADIMLTLGRCADVEFLYKMSRANCLTQECYVGVTCPIRCVYMGNM